MRTALVCAGICVATLTACLTGCTTPRVPKPLPVSEKIKFDQEIGSELADQLNPQLPLKADPFVQTFLDRIAQKIADGNPDLHIPRPRVFLLQDKTKKWNGYALPGGRVYISIGALKKTEYDNEAAALMAIQFAHLLKEHLLDALRALSKPSPGEVAASPAFPAFTTFKVPEELKFFGKDGIFSFTDNQELEAVETAVDLLYGAGYDPRGLLSLLENLETVPAHAPYDAALMGKAIERAQSRTVQLPPLRNPIVHTEEFFEFSKYVKEL
jgi:predicted Zn-dependent protease